MQDSNSSGKSTPEERHQMKLFLNHLESEFSRIRYWGEGHGEEVHNELLKHTKIAWHIGGKFLAEYKDMTEQLGNLLPHLKDATAERLEDFKSYVTFLRSDLNSLP